jgi:acyl-CoA synthetase (AMP-forming)/AMP-acid ligase II
VPQAAGEPSTVVEVLDATARRDPDREAYVEPAVDGRRRRSLTAGGWARASRGVAGLLERAGVGPGDVVALLLPSSIDYAVAYAAALRRGAVTTGLNPRLGPAELHSVVSRARPALTVVDESLEVALPPGAGTVVPRGALAEAADGPGPARDPRPEPGDAVAVVWTSGTTGVPKGAVFDHRCLRAVADGVDVLGRPGDRRLSPLPFAHVGYMTRLWDEAAHDLTTVITPTPWRATETLAVLAAERVTVAQGVPTQWALLMEEPGLEATDLSALRVAGTGAARMAAPLVAEIRRRLGVPVVVRYTSTETSLGTGTRPGDADEVVATTVGRPVAGVELAVVDGEGGALGPGETGRVRLRSAAAMVGYFADRREARPGPAPRGAAGLVDPVSTAAVRSADGWITTGDFGVRDEAGNLRLVGRANDLYLRGGYNVFPAEVEDVLAGHPAVARVAVVGGADPVLGQVGVAFVELRPGAEPPDLDELRARCRRVLADYKAPDALVVLDALPLTPMMKVDTRALAGPAAAAAAARRP